MVHQYRAHQGVDYRAPTGAPVVAVSTGTVVFAGFNGGSGRMVHLRHANGFESQYLHLSSIAVRTGVHVTQGDLIGRVGATGLATGPHLHYALKRNGVNVNPVAVHRAMPPGEPIPAGDLPRFIDARDLAFSSFPAAGASRLRTCRISPQRRGSRHENRLNGGKTGRNPRVLRHTPDGNAGATLAAATAWQSPRRQ